MMRIKAKMVGAGTWDDPYHVNLPNCTMDVARDISGNPIRIHPNDEAGIDSCDYIKMECFVFVPDDEVKDGHLDQARIRAKYGKWKDFNSSDVEITND